MTEERYFVSFLRGEVSSTYLQSFRLPQPKPPPLPLMFKKAHTDKGMGNKTNVQLQIHKAAEFFMPYQALVSFSVLIVSARGNRIYKVLDVLV